MIDDNDENTQPEMNEEEPSALSGGTVPSDDLLSLPTSYEIEPTEAHEETTPSNEEEHSDEIPQTDASGMPAKTGIAPESRKQNVKLDKAILAIVPIEDIDELKSLADSVGIPGSDQADMLKYIEKNSSTVSQIMKYLRNQSKTNSLTDDELRLTINGLINNRAMSLAVNTDYAKEILSREGSEWRSKKGPIGPKRPTISKGTSGTKLRGAAAVAHVRTAVGLSSAVVIPLPNTGIWINMAACDRWDLVTLVQKIGNEKSILGSDSAGGVFSNSSCYIRRHVVDLIASKIVSHSVLAEDGNGLMSNRVVAEMILITDYPAIITMMNQMVYSKGFEHVHACSNITNHCSSTFKVTINLAEMVVHDYARLSDKQNDFLIKAREIGSVTLEDIEKYQAMFEYNKNKVVRVNERVDFVFKVPTIGDSLKEGDRWMTEIRALIDKVVTQDAPEKEVEARISEYIDSSSIRRYTHWIDKILIYNVEMDEDGNMFRDSTEEPNYIDERDDISKSVIAIIDSNEAVTAMLEHYMRFIGDSNMSIVGSPQVSCPDCGAFQGASEKTENGYIVNAIVPFEAEHYFFTLLPETAS